MVGQLKKRELRGLILGKRHHQIRTDSLGRLLGYMLGHRPDEFGLVPDSEGFVTYKDLVQAIHEEDEWRYVRRSHINELMLTGGRSRLQSVDECIRSIDRRWELDLHNPSRPPLPKLLFTAVRRRAHPVVMEKGLKGVAGKYLVLSPVKDMALRIGLRRDQAPVVLEVLSDAAGDQGVVFFSFGDLFLSPEIPARFIAGPPLPKEVLERRKGKGTEKEEVVKGPTGRFPGTFILDPSRDPDPFRRAKGKKQKGWKEAARKMRKGQKGRP